MLDGKHVPLLFHKVNTLTLQTRLVDMVCNILLVLGIIGNVLGVFIFNSSRRLWRISSIYICLATCSSITNLLCLIQYASILHSRSRYILSGLVGKRWWACKIYEFSFSFRVLSAWITLFWMFERLICVSSRLQSFFNRWKSFKLKFIFPPVIILIILGCVIAPPVYMFQPQALENRIMNSTINVTKIYCGLDPDASVKWQRYFYEIRFGNNHFTVRCLFSELIPSGLIILLNVCLIHHLFRAYPRLHRNDTRQTCQNQSRTAFWMNTVLLLHSSLFLSSLFAHIAGHFMTVDAHETWWVSLAVLANCSLNFYIYCLSGKTYRNEIYRFIKRVETRLCCINDKSLTNRR